MSDRRLTRREALQPAGGATLFHGHFQLAADSGATFAAATGATDEVLHEITYDNPRRFLAVVPKRPRKR